MDRVRDFMRPFGLRTSGAKAELRERVQEAVERRVIPIARLIDYLDLVEPWGRQLPCSARRTWRRSPRATAVIAVAM